MTTACAPNTHQRPHRPATGARAVRSTAAGCTGTTKAFGKRGVKGHIGLACIGIRPAGITLQHLTPEIFRHAAVAFSHEYRAKSIGGTGDPLTPSPISADC